MLPQSMALRRLRRRREERGIILVFVVVLLSLLAIMGTAYLATSRADRQGMSARVSVPNPSAPRLADRSKLDALFTGASQRLQNVIIEDLFNLQPGWLMSRQGTGVSAFDQQEIYYTFRQQANAPSRSPTFSGVSTPFYENYDAPGRADPFLASLLPRNMKTTAGNDDIRWPWVSAPIVGEPRTALDGTASDTGSTQYGAGFARQILPGVDVDPFFTDPRFLGRTGYLPLNRWADQSGADVTSTPGLPQTLPRADVRISSVALLRSDSTTPQSKITRIYPGLVPNENSGAPRNVTMIAGDTDGDGIADGGLQPVVLNPRAPANTSARYVDQANGVIYFVSYRIVDNSAQINLNTALTVQGDFETAASFRDTNPTSAALGNAISQEVTTPPYVGKADGPNLGFFRSNVGMVELFREMLRPYSPTPSNTSPATREIANLIKGRFPFIDINTSAPDPVELKKFSREEANPALPSTAAYSEGGRSAGGAAVADFQFRSFGDMLEQTVARRPAAPGALLWTVGGIDSRKTSGLVSLPLGDSIALASGGGTLINPTITPSVGEESLTFSLRMAAPNFTTGTETAWRWFPANEVSLWYGWTKAFDINPFNEDTTALPGPGSIGMLDAAYDGDLRVFDYQPAGSGLAPARLPKSIRSLLTGYNGITSQAPQRRDLSAAANPASSLPWGMPGYGTDINNGQYPAAKVSAATGTKEQLWRAYWSAMTEKQTTGWRVNRKFAPNSNAADVGLMYDAFQPPDRHPSQLVPPEPATNDPQPILSRLNERQMSLVRSAVAACNTVDLRDPDQDVTAMTVDLGNVDPDDTTSDKVFARVYGTEKQLIITSVVIDDNDAPGSGSAARVYVEIHNPTDEPINLDAYRLGVVSRPTAAGVTLATGAITVPAVSGSPTLMKLTADSAPVTQMLQPGGFVIVFSDDGEETPPTGIHLAEEDLNPATPAANLPHNPQVIRIPSRLGLLDVQTPGLAQDRELVLMRTRRSDGIPSTEDNAGLASGAHSTYKRPGFSEGPVGANDRASILSMVPVDAVDFRSLTYPNPAVVSPTVGSGNRYVYLRTTVEHRLEDQLARPLAWKNFYAGQFFNMRPVTPNADPLLPGTPVAPDPSVRPKNAAGTTTQDWAWREYPNGAAATPYTVVDRLAEVRLGEWHEVAGEATQPITVPTPPDTIVPPPPAVPFRAPTIPIQNFKPYTRFPTAPGAGLIDHAPTQFPFGSPFARNGDILAVPFIGSYKIYRVPSGFTAASPQTLYEYVPVTMDAVAVATTNEDLNGATPSIGRFDARAQVAETPAPIFATYSNDWADDLFDYVTARQAPHTMMYPDVPRVRLVGTGTGYNDPTDPYTDTDGPVVGFDQTARVPYGNAGDDPATRVPWVNWDKPSGGATAQERGGDAVTLNSTAPGGSSLIAGVINLNTAPPIVRRMLPWAVMIDGRVDTSYADPSMAGGDAKQRQRNLPLIVETEVRDRTRKTPIEVPPYGLTSTMTLSDLDPVIRDTPPALQTAVPDQIMRVGDLQPFNRASNLLDFVTVNRDMTRMSNLVSQRSDVFTVYVTVQAWSWMGDNQTDDTRLLGERRGAFIVDRSRINETRFRPSDLIVIPVEQE